MPKKKLKMSKKAMLSRLYYQRSKLNKLKKEISKHHDVNSKFKIVFEGKKRTHKTIRNILLSRGLDINNVCSDLESKIKNHDFKHKIVKRTKKNQTHGRVKGDLDKAIGFAWERDNLDKYISIGRVKRVRYLNIGEYIDKETNLIEIYFLVDEYYILMQKYDVVYVRDHRDGNLEFFIVGYSDYKKAINSLDEEPEIKINSKVPTGLSDEEYKRYLKSIKKNKK